LSIVYFHPTGRPTTAWSEPPISVAGESGRLMSAVAHAERNLFLHAKTPMKTHENLDGCVGNVSVPALCLTWSHVGD
jgi:hypothetical protein